MNYIEFEKLAQKWCNRKIIMQTKKAKKFPQVRLSMEALKEARKVAKRRKESVSHYVSSLILKEL